MKKAYGEKKNFKKKTLKKIADFNSIIEEYQARGMKLTVRQCYYQGVARGIIPNNQEEYNKISELLSKGRLAGLIDWEAIEDRTRVLKKNQHFESPDDVLEAACYSYRINTRQTQHLHIEAWIEKESLVSILERTARDLDIFCLACKGQLSYSTAYEAAKRFKEKNKPGIILYAGDHDPSGLNIPKKIQEKFDIFGVNVEVRRIGLTLEQIQSLKVPSCPAKETDGNFAEYVKRTGLTEAWELDALPPEMLSELFKREIDALTDFEELRKMQKKEMAECEYLRNLIK